MWWFLHANLPTPPPSIQKVTGRALQSFSTNQSSWLETINIFHFCHNTVSSSRCHVLKFWRSNKKGKPQCFISKSVWAQFGPVMHRPLQLRPTTTMGTETPGARARERERGKERERARVKARASPSKPPLYIFSSTQLVLGVDCGFKEIWGFQLTNHDHDQTMTFVWLCPPPNTPPQFLVVALDVGIDDRWWQALGVIPAPQLLPDFFEHPW